MKIGLKPAVIGSMGTAVVCLLGTALAGGQAAQQQKPLMAEDVFKNIQVLKGVPVDQFMGTMGFIAASLSVNCTECHKSSDYSADTDKKKKAREMMLMVRAINKENFEGARDVTCYTCHRSSSDPKTTPSLAEQYGTPPDPDPNDIEVNPNIPTGLSADQILDKYIQALGGEQKLAGLKSFTAKGTYSGFDTDLEKVPAEFYAEAPNHRTVIAHRPNADNVTVYNGSQGWIAMTNTRLPLMEVTGGGLDGARLDGQLTFPAGIKQYLGRWRTGFPPLIIDGHELEIVQGFAPEGTRVKLFFDKQSGLLVRQVRFASTAIGFNPTQVDYSDYREVAGIKFPFHWTVSWTDGRSNYDITEIQPNVAVSASKFDEPVVPPAAATPPEKH